MPLIHCRDCGRKVSEHAETCPDCGAPISKRPRLKKHAESYPPLELEMPDDPDDPEKKVVLHTEGGAYDIDVDTAGPEGLKMDAADIDRSLARGLREPESKRSGGVLLVLLFLLLLCGGGAAAYFFYFQPRIGQPVTHGRFEVDMPKKPKQETRTLDTPNGVTTITTYEVDAGSHSCAFSVREFPEKSAEVLKALGPKHYLKGFRDKLIGTDKRLSNRELEIHGYQALEFSFESADQQLRFARAIFTDRAAVLLITSGKKGNYTKADALKFWESFRVK